MIYNKIQSQKFVVQGELNFLIVFIKKNRKKIKNANRGELVHPYNRYKILTHS